MKYFFAVRGKIRDILERIGVRPTRKKGGKSAVDF
jgi:hypothetical protein